MNTQKKVGIFTTFYNFDPAYSLVSVVKDQLVAHLAKGYKPVLFVLESFPESNHGVPLGVDIRRIVPQIILEPYAGLNVPENYKEDVDRVVAALKEHAVDIDIMITHDIVFIDTYLPYNLALRESALPCKYFHWIHSAPSPRPVLENNLHSNRYNLPPNSKLVYLNHDKDIALAEMYGTFPRNVRVIPNSRDPRTFWDLDPFVSALVDKYDLFSADVISVYPLSTTRMTSGKQIDVVIKIHQKLRELGLKTKLIVPNAHANGENEKKECLLRASQDVIFTSLEGAESHFPGGKVIKQYENGVSAKIVSDFFRLSNVFIFPSISENCSLVLLEAMLAGNILVLNKDCSGLQEFGGENAIYFKMGNLDMGIRNEEVALKNENYFLDMAKIIRSELQVNKPLKAKMSTLRKYNYQSIFDRIEGLYYEGDW